MLSLQDTANFAQPFIQFSPLNAGAGSQPFLSIGTMIRDSICSAPQTWSWNRKEVGGIVITPNTQDYTVALTDFDYLEKAALTDASGNQLEIKYVYNNLPLSSDTTGAGRPNGIAVLNFVPYVSATFRLLDVPNQSYTLTITYQRLPLAFQFFNVTSVSVGGGNATYTGTFITGGLPIGSFVTVAGFVNPGNNGTFRVTASTNTTFQVVNASGVNESASATASNLYWDPIPDWFVDVFNNLYLAESLALVDENRSQLYRLRGVSAFLSKSAGLTETQKNAFSQQWMARSYELATANGDIQLGTRGRSQ